MPDWEAIRSEFPALAEWTYLNTATFGQVPRRAVEAAMRHFARRDQFACRDFMRWFDDADRLRGSVARLIHCEPSDIAFITNASSGLSLLMGGLDWKPGDQIVTLEHEFPNNYYYSSYLERFGVEFIETTWDRFYASITPRTRVVAISTVSYSSGFRAPVEEISAFLHGRGVLLCLDGTQSVGALRFDTARVRPDVFAVHGYKWLLSPNGAGFLYVSPEMRERLAPNVIGWRSHRYWRDPENLHHGMPEFSADAEKYEGGMLAFTVNYAMEAVIEMLLQIGTEVIEQRVLEMTEKTRAVLRRHGAVLLSDLHPHYDSPIIAARLGGRDASELVRSLEARKVLVAARHGNLRVSPHFYNNEEDLARLDAALG
jgi:selenocysteine lyase/cysteine desulfurase